jgi:hypothetical protein
VTSKYPDNRNRGGYIFEDEGDRLALIEQAIQLTPSYAASYSQQNKKDQGSFLIISHQNQWRFVTSKYPDNRDRGG